MPDTLLEPPRPRDACDAMETMSERQTSPGPPRALTDMRATPERKRAYVGACVVLAAIGTAFLPLADRPLAAIPEFNVFYVTAVILGDLTTAFLLYGQFRASGRMPLVVLASAYLFTASLVVPHLLYFSEFAPRTGWFAGQPQSAAWLWHIWHIAFPAAVLVYVVAESRAGAVVADRRGRIVAGAIAGVLTASMAATLLVTTFADALPELHDGRVWNPITYQLGWAMGVTTVVALVAVLRLARHGRVLHLWLGVALTAFLFDILPNMAAMERFAFGWYYGRVSGILAATFLLCMLLREIALLYVSLSDALDEVGRLNVALESRVGERTRALEEANRALRVAVSERDLLLSEVYHRVNNNLQRITSLLSLERRRITDPELRASLDRMASRARAMGLVHRHLMGGRDLNALDLAGLLQALGAALDEALDLPGRDIRLEIRADGLRGDIDVAVPLGLVVNELVWRIARHAFGEGEGGSIRVVLREVEERWRLEVSHDGTGLAPDEPDLGLRIVRTLAMQLDGTFDSYGERGECSVLSFPRPGTKRDEATNHDRRG